MKPTSVVKGGIANISLSTLSRRALEGVSILVIGPNGNPSRSNEEITKLTPLQFPTNFNGGSTMLSGNYSVVVLSNATNDVLVSMSFSVLINPWISSFTNFIFGKGLVFTIGIIASIVPIIYQLASEETNERNTRLQNKAKWMIDNQQSYINLWSASNSIYLKFQDGKTKQFVYRKVDPNEILYDIIYFYKEFLAFKKKTGFYYFDDLLAEYFLASLEDTIFDQFDKIIGNGKPRTYTELVQFFKLKSLSELAVNTNSKIYSDNIQKWISDKDQVNDFYLNHLTYYLVLFVSVNKASFVTYTSSSKMKKGIDGGIEPYKQPLKSHIEKLNHSFYEEKDLYYNLLDRWMKVKF